MTYLNRRRPVRPVQRNALGGVFDVFEQLFTGQLPGDSEIKNAFCPQGADAFVAQMDATIADTDRRWNPTGFYTPDQIATIVNAGLSFIGPTTEALENDLRGVFGVDVPQPAYDNLQRKLIEVQPFIRAANEARTKGIRVVNAPGMKAWIMDTMKAGRQLAREVALEQCRRSTLANGTRVAEVGIRALHDVVIAIVGVVAAAGETVLDAATGIFALLKHAKWIALAGGAGYLLYKAKQRRDRSA